MITRGQRPGASTGLVAGPLVPAGRFLGTAADGVEAALV